MSEPEITVVRVEWIRSYGAFAVLFSEPVHLRDLGMDDCWYAELDDFSVMQGDELSAFMWGQSVIQAHYRRVAEEQTHAT